MYAKLFASLYQGTLRGRADEILVFTNLLAHADQHGIVDKHFRAIAEDIGISQERVKTAVEYLEAPDIESRSDEQDGRRLIRMDGHRAWGWLIVNYAKYRAIRNEDDRREQNRQAQERWRNKNKQSKPRKPRSAQAEAEADTDSESIAPNGAIAAARARRADDERIRLPKDWRSSADCRAYASDKGLDPESTDNGFVDYFCEGRGRNEKRTLAGWDRRHRAWVDREASYTGQRGRGPVRPADDRSEAAAFYRAGMRLAGK